MTTAISDLSTTTALSGADLFPISSATDRDTRKASLDAIKTWLQSNLTFLGLNISQQYAAPSATGFNVAITAADTWLILTPTGGFAAGTITLPATRSNEQVVRVNCTQAVTALTVAGNGTTVTGAPTTLAANAFFTLQYDSTTNAWYRVG